jgi:hypothetical protein
VTASTIILRLHKPQPRTHALAVERYLGEQLPFFWLLGSTRYILYHLSVIGDLAKRRAFFSIG